MMWRMKSGNGTAEAVTSFVRLRTVPVARSTSISSPSSVTSTISRHSTIGSPTLIEFRKKIRAKVEATQQPNPQGEGRVEVLQAVLGQLGRVGGVEVAGRDDDVGVHVGAEAVDLPSQG